MLRFNDIADRVLEYDPDCNLELLQRAYVFSAKVHEGQERLSGEPYLIHPLEVAGILVDMRLDDVSIAAGLLHDTVEDTLASLEEIDHNFGEEVAFLVEGLTKISKVQFRSAQARQAGNFRKMLVAMSKDIRILLIKLADRIHNMRTLTYMEQDKAQAIAQETLDIYVPLASRLGINWMRGELEDLAFRTLHPDAAGELEGMLRGRHVERDRYIEEVKSIVTAKLAEAGLVGEVAGRLKDLASIHAKMTKQGVSLDQIYDVIAFRLVLEGEAEQVYAALGVMHATWPPVPGRFKDYVALPKPNGYKSLHTTVIGPYGERMELQIRTVDMNLHAELGIAAHWRYKGQSSGTRDEDEQFDWLRQLLERQREVDDPHEFLDAVKVDLFSDEVFIFTPDGDVINLPRGATALDFAYGVHSEVGDHCSGAKVNGTQKPLSHVLESGDTVEVVTQNQQVPKKDWLDFVISGKAKTRIRHAVRLAENERSRELGRGILDRELRKGGLSLARVQEAGDLETVASKLVKSGAEELFAAVGYGRVAPRLVLEALRPDLAETPKAEPPARRLRNLFRRERPDGKTGIRVDGHGDVLVRFGQCCSPLPGDEIIGFVTRGRGVTVHGRDCRIAFELDKDRCIEVDWETEADVTRRIRIRVTSRDAPGLLAKITNTISSAGVNIGSARIDTHEDNTATQTFDLWVKDARSLKATMKDIQKVKGVLAVERIRA